MIDYFVALYLMGFFFTIPFLLLMEEENTVRDILLMEIVYPLWLAPLLIYVLVILLYCIIMNKTINEGYTDVDSKIGNWKIMKVLERFYK
jgi:hypothetical protein